MSYIKKERADDAEIDELAAKIVQANKAKTQQQQQQQQQQQIVGGNVNNRNSSCTIVVNQYKGPGTNGKRKTPGALPSTAPSSTTNSAPTTPSPSSEKVVAEERTQRGQFGWVTIGKVHVPYIYRGRDEQYCAVRMLEVKLLDKYLNFLNQDIYNCTCIRSYYITESEARLLNEINIVHADFLFGRHRFTGEDLIVKLSDAIEFYNFLDACYTKLRSGSSNPLDRCGFIRINKESVVPYTVYQGVKFVPLFYFEGETESLKMRANKLEGWDLCYLKFCCKVQGIRNELFAHDSCSVISLNDIRNYFPPATTFEDYWPQKMVDTQCLISTRNTNQASAAMGRWTRQPVGPPIATAPHTHAAKQMAHQQQHKASVATVTSEVNIAAVPQTQQMLPQLFSTYMNQLGSRIEDMPDARQQHVAYPAPATTTPCTMPCSYTCAGGATSAPAKAAAPLILRSVRHPGYPEEDWPSSTNVQTTTAANYMMLNGGYSEQQHQHQAAVAAAAQMRKYHPTPPLVPVRQLNGMLYQQANTSTASPRPDLSANQLINQQPAHQQSMHTQPTSTQDDRTNGRIMNSGGGHRKIADTAAARQAPYKISKAVIDGKVMPALNLKPYVHTDLLVTLQDFVDYFFTNVPVHTCQQALECYGVQIIKANPGQMAVLLETGKALTGHLAVNLVHVRNLIELMPQLKYILHNYVRLQKTRDVTTVSNVPNCR